MPTDISRYNDLGDGGAADEAFQPRISFICVRVYNGYFIFGGVKKSRPIAELDGGHCCREEFPVYVTDYLHLP